MKLKSYTKESMLYSIPSMPSGWTISFSSTYWTLFLTGTVGISTVAMASIMSISSICDAVSMPLSGIIVQKTHFRGGKFRPWLLIGAIACCILRWLTFTDIGVRGATAVAWFAGTYILCFFSFNLYSTAYAGIMPLLASDPQDRVLFSSNRMLISSIGRLILSAFGLTMIGIMGAGNDARGYNLVALLIGVLFVLSVIPVVTLAKKVDKPVEKTQEVVETAREKVSLLDMLKTVISKNYLLFLGGQLGRMTTQIMSGQLAAYYYRYVLNDLPMLTWYLTASSFFGIIGALLGPIISKAFGQVKKTEILGTTCYGLMLLAAYFFGKTGVSFTALLCTGTLFLNMAASADAALYSNVVDYTEWRTGKDIRAFMMSMLTMANKFAMFLSTSIFGWGLVAIGFDTQNVTDQARNGIRVMMSGLPACFCAVSVICLLFLKLTDDQNRQIQQELRERRAAAAAEKEGK